MQLLEVFVYRLVGAADEGTYGQMDKRMRTFDPVIVASSERFSRRLLLHLPPLWIRPSAKGSADDCSTR